MLSSQCGHHLLNSKGKKTKQACFQFWYCVCLTEMSLVAAVLFYVYKYASALKILVCWNTSVAASHPLSPASLCCYYCIYLWTAGGPPLVQRKTWHWKMASSALFPCEQVKAKQCCSAEPRAPLAQNKIRWTGKLATSLRVLFSYTLHKNASPYYES